MLLLLLPLLMLPLLLLFAIYYGYAFLLLFSHLLGF
jgi:hypothetical protein